MATANYYPTISPPSQNIADAIRATIKERSETPIVTSDDGDPPFSLWWDDFGTLIIDENKPGTRDFTRFLSQRETNIARKEYLERLKVAAEDDDTHVQGLEDVWSTRVMKCHWRLESHTTKELSDYIVSMLGRMVDTPPPLPDCDEALLRDFPLSYFQDPSRDRSWENLKVVQALSQNLVCYATYLRLSELHGGFLFNCLNGVSGVLVDVGMLIQAIVEQEETPQEGSSHSSTDRYRLFIVRAYLWCFWQRFQLLFQLFVLRESLIEGVADGEISRLASAENFILAPGGISLRAFTEQAARQVKPASFCGWAFELLYGESLSIGLDFSLLFDLFEEGWASTPQDCRVDGTGPCEGRNWNMCSRFARTLTANQTMHGVGCSYQSNPDPTSEPRVVWDEASYRQVLASSPSSGVAVSIQESTGANQLRYCPASNRTMAISHVWSHGQGGRPHEGINRCLHERYMELAKSLGLDSYWIDSACIPEPDELRSAAILTINTVFYQSGCVLVCDMVLMAIDASPPISTRTYELILAVVLLSDWNIRAWTMLEALKGRGHVGILCRDNHVVPVSDVLRHVANNGRIGIAVFGLLLPHMLAWVGEGKPRLQIHPSDISLEIAASWLSYRPASRPSDYLTIWSLCLSQHQLRAKTATEFWDQQRAVDVEFLLSSSDRIRGNPADTSPSITYRLLSAILRGQRETSLARRYRKGNKIMGRSWAPASPFVLPSEEGRSIQRPLPGYSGGDASITPIGIWATCSVYYHNFSFGQSVARALVGPVMPDVRLAPQMVRQFKFIQKSLNVRAKHMALLVPQGKTDRGRRTGRYTAELSRRSQSSKGTPVAVCQSDKDSRDRARRPPDETSIELYDPWEWMGVYQWPSDVPLPLFKNDYIWIA